MSDNIPFEIQLEIIKKVLDIKSLVLLRSVSKPWKSFIESPEFVAAYGSREAQPHRLLLRYKKAGAPNEVKYLSFINDENGILTQQQQQDFAPNGPLLMKQFKHEFVIGSSCGLWGLYGFKPESMDTYMVVIWNPSIRKSVGIVVPCLLKTAFGRLNHFGFGVCPSTYDPTIVVMSYSYRKLESKDTPWQVGIFTLRSKTWKMIPSSNVPHESIGVRSSTVSTVRFIFWVAYDKIVNNYGVLLLDLITHEFKMVDLLDRVAKYWTRAPSISKLKGSLVVSTYTVEVTVGLVYDIWLMREEGGVMASLTKLFNITIPYSLVRKVSGYTKNGEPLIETKKDDEQFTKIKVYEPYSEHINDLGITGGQGSFFICPCTETLLLIDHSDGFIISNDY